MSNEVLEIMTENGLVSVDVNDIPDIITSSIDNISKLEDQIRTAEESANKAMEYVSKVKPSEDTPQMQRYEEKRIFSFKFRSGDTKDIIEDTQEAVEKLATAQQVSVEALKKSFEFQKKLAETSKYLFDLGCANITVNRIAVRAIELKLSGASKETLSDLAKQEMMAVVKQLKEQEDILKKQEFLNSKVKEHASRLDGKDNLDKEQSEKIESLSEKNKYLNQKISEIHDVLTLKDRVDAEQTHRLEELMVLLQNKDLIDEKQENSIAENRILIDKNSEAIKILIEYTKQKDFIDKEQSIELGSLKNALQRHRKLYITAIVIASFSLVCCIVSILPLLLK